jgi:hypothetical protein
MTDTTQRTYRPVRPEYRGEPSRSYSRGALSAAWLARHEARIAAETERVQAELIHHPEVFARSRAKAEASADRLAVASYRASREGRAARRWLAADLGWTRNRVDRTIKLSAWFARERTYVRLTPAGWAAVKEHS